MPTCFGKQLFNYEGNCFFHMTRRRFSWQEFDKFFTPTTKMFPIFSHRTNNYDVTIFFIMKLIWLKSSLFNIDFNSKIYIFWDFLNYLLQTLPRNELLCQLLGEHRQQWISYKMKVCHLMAVEKIKILWAVLELPVK